MIAKPSKNGITNGSEARDIKSVPAKRPADQQQPGRMTINARKKVKGNAESGIFTRLEASMQTANRIGTCYECLQIATQYGAWNSVVRHMEEKTLDNLGDLDTVKAKEMLEACTFMKQSDLDTFGDPSSLASALFESKNRVRDMVDEEGRKGSIETFVVFMYRFFLTCVCSKLMHIVGRTLVSKYLVSPMLHPKHHSTLEYFLMSCAIRASPSTQVIAATKWSLLKTG